MTNQRYRNTYVDGCCHFCTASVFGFKPLLADEQSARLVLAAWNRQRRRWGVELLGYVIMPQHVHLVLRGTAEAVRKFMQYSLAQSSREIRALLTRRSTRGDADARSHLAFICSSANGRSLGKVWKERFRAVALDREDAVLIKLEYMHNNPVRRGLVERSEAWPWSSCASYIGATGPMAVDLPL